MAAVLGAEAIRLHHHGERIPAYIGLVAPLQGAISGIVRLLRLGDGIEVGGIRLEGQVGAGAAREVHQLLEQEVGAFRALRTHDRIDRFQPLLRFDGINVFERRLLSHKCTRPRVLLRWQARYSADCADCQRYIGCLTWRYLRGLVFHGQARDRPAVSRYAHSLALRPPAGARAPNRRTAHRFAACPLLERHGVPAAHAERRGLARVAARRVAARPVRAQGAQGRRLLSFAGRRRRRRPC